MLRIEGQTQKQTGDLSHHKMRCILISIHKVINQGIDVLTFQEGGIRYELADW